MQEASAARQVDSYGHIRGDEIVTADLGAQCWFTPHYLLESSEMVVLDEGVDGLASDRPPPTPVQVGQCVPQPIADAAFELRAGVRLGDVVDGNRQRLEERLSQSNAPPPACVRDVWQSSIGPTPKKLQNCFRPPTGVPQIEAILHSPLPRVTTRGNVTVAAMDRPAASSAEVTVRMSRQVRTGTKPELAIRRELHRRGFRYRVNRAPLAGIRRSADIVFGRDRVVVMIDGCFWHRCPEHGTAPKSNAEWWDEKLGRNVERDEETNRLLAAAGWTVLRFWEHEDPQQVADRIDAVLRARRSSRPSPRSTVPPE